MSTPQPRRRLLEPTRSVDLFLSSLVRSSSPTTIRAAPAASPRLVSHGIFADSFAAARFDLRPGRSYGRGRGHERGRGGAGLGHGRVHRPQGSVTQRLGGCAKARSRKGSGALRLGRAKARRAKARSGSGALRLGRRAFAPTNAAAVAARRTWVTRGAVTALWRRVALPRGRAGALDAGRLDAASRIRTRAGRGDAAAATWIGARPAATARVRRQLEPNLHLLHTVVRTGRSLSLSLKRGYREASVRLRGVAAAICAFSKLLGLVCASCPVAGTQARAATIRRSIRIARVV